MIRYLSIFFILFCLSALGQVTLDGTWKGVLIRAGKSIDDGILLYADFKINNGTLDGRMREELYNTPHFAVKRINGSVTNNELSFNQFVIERSSKIARTKWCRYSGKLTYNEKTGFLEGDYKSDDCRRVMGKIILYRTEFELSTGEDPETSHLWFTQFLKDRKEGLAAPEIREIERKNFVFEPIYFDFDKYEIRPEHMAFLDRLIKVVKGHSDLRVKVTGHTDSRGTDAYNDTLSQNRAKAIIDYFVAHGLSADRLEFEFKGESQPVDTNNTPEGRQRNRRVDFSFI